MFAKKPIWIGTHYFKSHYEAAKALPAILKRKLTRASALQYIRIVVVNSKEGNNRIKLLDRTWVSETAPEPQLNN
jgi:hypothetical protein